jgi:hypothetical protein
MCTGRKHGIGPKLGGWAVCHWARRHLHRRTNGDQRGAGRCALGISLLATFTGSSPLSTASGGRLPRTGTCSATNLATGAC